MTNKIDSALFLTSSKHPTNTPSREMSDFKKIDFSLPKISDFKKIDFSLPKISDFKKIDFSLPKISDFKKIDFSPSHIQPPTALAANARRRRRVRLSPLNYIAPSKQTPKRTKKMRVFLYLFLCTSVVFSQNHRQLLKGVLTNDSLHCNDVREKLFHPTTEIDAQRLEFERFLPVYMKTQLFDLQTDKHNEKHLKDEKHTKGWDVEFPFTFEHPRFHVMGPIGPRCRTPIESYGSNDDEKRACGLQQLQKINQAVSVDGKKHECVIYSIGSKGQWGFEESILAKTQCRVETFDCTMAKDYQVPAHIKESGRVRFHPICLADSDYEIDDRRYVSWTTLNKITGVATQPSFLKIDIEGYEFPVLKSIIDSGVFLPLQIAAEIHIIRVTNGKWDLRRANSLELYSFMNYLYKFGGYYLIDRHDNVNCKSCTEVVLAKLNCENFPRPDNYKEILLSSEDLQHTGFKNTLKESLAAKYYG